MKFMKILFVCVGNINRSVAAEIICKKLAPQHEVKSCGLNGVSNHSITNKMRTVLTGMGYEVPAVQKSTGITQALLDWADWVIVMDKANLKRLQEFAMKGLIFYTDVIIKLARFCFYKITFPFYIKVAALAKSSGSNSSHVFFFDCCYSKRIIL